MIDYDWHKGYAPYEIELIYRNDIVRYIEDQFIDRDTKSTVQLATAQKDFITEALRRKDNGALAWSIVAYTALKKSYKTGLTAARAVWTALKPEQEIYFIARSKEQATDRAFSMLSYSLSKNEYPKIAGQTKTRIDFTNGSYIKVLPCTTAVAGINYNLVCLTEGWSWHEDLHHTVWAELAIPPFRRSRPDMQAAIHIDSYAGYTNVSSVISELWRNIVKGKEATPNDMYPGVFYSEQDILYIQDQLPRLSFQTPEYYRSQKLALSPADFARQCLNRHVPNYWKGADEDDVKTVTADFNLNLSDFKVSAGLDMAMSDDLASICVLAVDIEKEIAYEIETVTFAPPISFFTVEQEIHTTHDKYMYEFLGLDIWQTGYLSQKMDFARVVSQSTGRKVGDTLTYNWLRSGKLRLIENGSVSNAWDKVTIKSVGEDFIRFTKKGKAKIDPLVACSMALFTAIYPESVKQGKVKDEGLVTRRGIPIITNKKTGDRKAILNHQQNVNKYVLPEAKRKPRSKS